MLNVGDQVRLLRGRFAGLKAGDIGTVTDMSDDGLSFSVNGHSGCLAQYWELIGQDGTRRTLEFRKLFDQAWKEMAEIEAILENLDTQREAA